MIRYNHDLDLKKKTKKNYGKKNITKKKKLFTDRQTDGRTNGRTTQNYSSEPQKREKLYECTITFFKRENTF